MVECSASTTVFQPNEDANAHANADEEDEPFALSHFSVPFLLAQTPVAITEFEMPFIHDEEFENVYSQKQSPLFRLPGEIRNEIYRYAMINEKPVVDPWLNSTYANGKIASSMGYLTRYHSRPHVGINLLRACRRIHNEVDMTTLYSDNRFRFTTSFSAQTFLAALPKRYRLLIRDVEIDLCCVADAHSAVEKEWTEYLSWKDEITPNMWAAKVGSLHLAAPNITTLRFNIEQWNTQATMRGALIMQDVLKGPRNLQRVVLTGRNGAELLFGLRDEYLQKWGPVTFVGVMRFYRLAGMGEWMADCVEGQMCDKLVTWEKRGNIASLEIMTPREYKVQTGRYPSELKRGPRIDIYEGACSYEAYERRWQSKSWPLEVEG